MQGSQISIAGNKISEFAQTGIHLDGVSDSIVESNTVKIDQATGIRIVGGMMNRVLLNEIIGVQTFNAEGLVFGDLVCSTSNQPTVQGNTFSSLEVGLNVLCSTYDLTFFRNRVTQSQDAIVQQPGAVLSVQDFEGKVFEDNTRHLTFVTPVVGRQNTWSDIDSMRIFDSNGDGLGDCGADFPYTSRMFDGVTTAENRTDLSFQVQDIEPVTSATGNCPP